MTPVPIGAVSAAAERFYAPLPYHNFGHALEVLSAVEVLLERCRVEGVGVDPFVVRAAALFHDAGYAEDFVALGAADREELAARIAAAELSRLGVPVETVGMVVSAILATRATAVPETLEDVLVRAADLAGLAAGYDVFAANARRLHEEAELLAGRPVPFDVWLSGVEAHLSAYLAEDLRLTSSHDLPDGSSAFHVRAGANLARFVAEHRP